MNLFSDTIDIPEGDFLMGCDPAWDMADYHEEPQITVWLSQYCIQRRPVSVDQWRQFVQETEYEWPFWQELDQVCPGGNYPVVCVSWFDCQAFINWLNRRSVPQFALPTEAQWEKASRGMDGRSFPWGNDYKSELYDDDCMEHLHQRFPLDRSSSVPSVYGCLDMGLNVFEWCRDWFNFNYLRKVNPVNPFWDVPDLEGAKSQRGGTPCVKSPHCWHRYEAEPEAHHNDVGFRLVVNAA